MLMVSNLVGFGAGGELTLTPVPQGAGTVIGNMTSGGGNAAAFDGITNQARASSAWITPGTSGFVGKQWSAPKLIAGLRAWAPNNAGFVDTNGAPTATCYLEGSDNNFSSVTQLWTGSVSGIAATFNITRASIITTTSFLYHRFRIAVAPGSDLFVAEVEFDELV